MRITSLIENAPGNALPGEHGLSLWIEFAGRCYLLDAGATGTCLDNAVKLGINVSSAQAAFLSHGHFDHSGGFRRFLQENTQAKVYVRAQAQQRCFCRKDERPEYIGVPEGMFQEDPDRYIFLDEDREIAPGVWLMADHVPHTEARAAATGMLVEGAHGLEIDTFAHEQSLVLVKGEELVIFNSCCHAGVVEIVQEIASRFQGYSISAVVGGFHLMGSGGTETLGVSEETVSAVAKGLMDLRVKRVLTGHCTGRPAYQLLQKQLGDRLEMLTTGSQFLL